MNSTLQCLAHTAPLRDYFLSGRFRRDLNTDNPLGTGGELAREFASLLTEMWRTKPPSSLNGGRHRGYGGKGLGWGGSHYSRYSSSGDHDTTYPRSFKSTLGRHAEQFVGYDQHDSQELAIYLLDALHEDTNRVRKKPYVEKPEQGPDESDAEASETAWAAHLVREDSRILEQFMGQIKSRLECPVTGNTSTTFDPSMYLSVPIPGSTDRTMKVTFVPLEGERKAFTVTLGKNSTVVALRSKVVDLARECYGTPDLAEEDVALCDVFNDKVWKFYDKQDEAIDSIKDTDVTVAYELFPLKRAREEFAAYKEEEEKAKKSSDGGDGDDDEDTIRPQRAAAEDICLSGDESSSILNDADRRLLDERWTDKLAEYMVSPTRLYHLTSSRARSREVREATRELYRDIIMFVSKCRDAAPSVPAGGAGSETEDDDARSSDSLSSANLRREIARDAAMEGSGDENVAGGSADSSSSSPARKLSAVNLDEVPTPRASPPPAAEAEASSSTAIVAAGPPRPPTLAEVSEASTTFRNVKNPLDVATIEYCGKKLMERKMTGDAAGGPNSRPLLDPSEDGIVVQIKLRTTQPAGNASTAVRGPFVLRLSSALTVGGLREVLADRLGGAVRTSVAEDKGSNDNDDDEDLYGFGPMDESTDNGADPASALADAVDTGGGDENDPSSSSAAAAEVDTPSSMLRRCALSSEEPSRFGGASGGLSRPLGGVSDHEALSRSPDTAGASADLEDGREKQLVCRLLSTGSAVTVQWPARLRSSLDASRIELDGNSAGAWLSAEQTRERERIESAGKNGDDPNKVTLMDCIRKYCEREQLDDSEMWYCSKCKDHVRAWKELHVYRTPPILIIHLKRFHFSATTHRRDKIDTLVHFPLVGLDLRDHVSHREGNGIEPVYDCYAVSNHFGGLGGGHYTAYCKEDDGTWSNYDDGRVTPDVDEKEVVSSAAYCLYYKRRDVVFEKEIVFEGDDAEEQGGEASEAAAGGGDPLASAEDGMDVDHDDNDPKDEGGGDGDLPASDPADELDDVGLI